jgi:hypothetical protein
VLNILLHVSAFLNAIIRESYMNMLRRCPMSLKSREGWELYIVTDGVMVGMVDHYAFPSSSAFHDIGHHLSMFI